MAERSQNLQDLFLNSVRKTKNPLTIFLINGVKLTGVVTSFDNFCVLLRRDGHSQLVYKHAISTIMPGHPVQLFEQTDDHRLLAAFAHVRTDTMTVEELAALVTRDSMIGVAKAKSPQSGGNA